MVTHCLTIAALGERLTAPDAFANHLAEALIFRTFAVCDAVVYALPQQPCHFQPDLLTVFWAGGGRKFQVGKADHRIIGGNAQAVGLRIGYDPLGQQVEAVDHRFSFFCVDLQLSNGLVPVPIVHHCSLLSDATISTTAFSNAGFTYSSHWQSSAKRVVSWARCDPETLGISSQ